MKFPRRRVLLFVVAIGVVLPNSLAALPAAIRSHDASAPATTGTWSAFHSASGTFNDFQWGGLASGDLFGDGHIEIVAAWPDGLVQAFAATDGTLLWQHQTDGRISSTPTIADLYNNGLEETIVTTKGGSVYVWDPNGNLEPGWPRHTIDGGSTGFADAFFASVAVGDLFGNGARELTATSWDHYLYVWDAAGNFVPGFPINLADSAWSTPALVPSTVHAGQLDIIAGADSDGGIEPYPKGGEYFRFVNTGCPDVNYVLNHGGNSCQTPGAWAAQIKNIGMSSPAVLFNGSQWMTVTGSGYFFGAPGGENCPDANNNVFGSCGKQLSLRNPDATTGSPGWTLALSTGQIQSSPAVGNLGNGDNNDIVFTSNGSNAPHSCIYAVDHTGTSLGGSFPLCNSIVQLSNPTIGPVDGSGVNGIWIGDGGFLKAYSHTGGLVSQTTFGDGSGYIPGAPVLFNTGSGVHVAAIGGTSADGGNYNTWQVSVAAIAGSPAVVGHNVWPRFHGDSSADGMAVNTIAPSVPGNIAVTPGDGQAALTWTAPADTGSAATSTYSVYIYDRTSNLATGLTNPQVFGTNSGTITGLTNGQPYFLRITAGNGATSDYSVPTYSFTPVAAAPPATTAHNTNSGNLQYRLPNSDGATWQDMDPTNLAMTVSPSAPGNYLVTGNADLWTSQGGYNQDIGLCVVATVSTCTGANIVAWKESGGFAGTFSPNAAYVQQVVAMTPGTSYTVKLMWKTNKPARGATIWAAAGNNPNYSPSRLSVRQLAAGGDFKSITTQQKLTNNDSTSWVPIDATNLTASVTGASGQVAIFTGNADLFTDSGGYNQDVGILVKGTGFAAGGTVVAWKESGGFAGTYSPNAAFVEAAIPLPGTGTYTATLVWKTNKVEPNGVTVYDGAAPSAPFSPTTIVAQVVAADHAQSFANPTTAQYTLPNSDGVNWTEVHSAVYSQTITEPVGSSTCLAVVSANADLWTTTGGFNQDLGIFINNGAGPAAWKESGGFAGTFSPNAAMVETELVLTNAQPITIRWKTNRSSGTTIYAGAGNQGSALGFSPTTLLVQYIGC